MREVRGAGAAGAQNALHAEVDKRRKDSYFCN